MSEWGHHTFRRKSRMYLPTITMTSLLGPTVGRRKQGPLDHPESEIASECGDHTFRRKSRMYLPTITMISLLGPTRARKHKATEFRLRISFPNFEPKVYICTNSTLIMIVVSFVCLYSVCLPFRVWSFESCTTAKNACSALQR